MEKNTIEYSGNNFALRRTVTTGRGDYVSFALHSHNTYEIFILKSEKAVFYAEGTIYHLQKNDVMIFNDKELHNISFDNSQPYDRIVIHFHPISTLPYDTEKYKLLNIFTSRKNGKNNYIPREMLEKTCFFDIMNKMEELVSSPADYTDIYSHTLFIQLLIELSNASSLSDIQDYPRLSNEKIRRVLSYINDNLDEDLSLDILAKKFYISKYSLCHLFKASTGFSVKQYITYRRVAMAQKFMAAGQSTLDACIAAGFNDYSNFYKTFKKILGKPPKEFK